jgi:hypothetical protein
MGTVGARIALCGVRYFRWSGQDCIRSLQQHHYLVIILGSRSSMFPFIPPAARPTRPLGPEASLPAGSNPTGFPCPWQGRGEGTMRMF